MAHGTHDYVDDPRNADILISVNGQLVPRAEATVSVLFWATASGKACAFTPVASPFWISIWIDSGRARQRWILILAKPERS